MDRNRVNTGLHTVSKRIDTSCIFHTQKYNQIAFEVLSIGQNLCIAIWQFGYR